MLKSTDRKYAEYLNLADLPQVEGDIEQGNQSRISYGGRSAQINMAWGGCAIVRQVQVAVDIEQR
jgi:hypothetical protein